LTTLAELFQNEGYATACIGKWHLGFEDRFLPHNQGFDYYFGLLHNLDSYEVFHFEEEGGMPLLRNGEVLTRNPDPGTLTRLYTEEAISWMKQMEVEAAPFFLYLPHTMLHHPMGASEAFKGSSDWGLYGDAIQEMDFYVGQLVDALEGIGIDDNTIIVYASDNGRGPGRNEDQAIRGGKITSYEGGLRVPCIAFAPGLIQQGATSNAVVHAMDWYPTLASLAGIEIPDNILLDGRDLSALLTGETNGIPAFREGTSLNATVPLRRNLPVDEEWHHEFTREEYLNAFFYHGSQGALAAVRSGKWKLFLNPTLILYDLEKDPGERTPVNDSGIARKLRGMAIQFQREMTKTF